MSKDNVKRLKLIYGIVMAALLTVVGVCLIVSCIGIYRMGGSPFSRESVAEAFSKICIPVYIALGWLVLGAVMMIIYPDEIIKPKGSRTPSVLYRNLEKKIDLTSCDERVTALNKAKKSRLILGAAAIAICVVCVVVSSIVAVSVILDSDIQNANQTVTKCSLIALPMMVVAFAAGLLGRVFTDKSFKKSADIAKALIAQKECLAGGNVIKSDNESKEKRILLIVKIAIIAVGVTLLVLGIFGDGIKGTLEKAIRICTECIGLG